MAVDFINEIYDNAEAITELKKIAEICRYGQKHIFGLKWDALREKLASFCRNIYELDNKLSSDIWSILEKIRDAAGENDYRQIGDLIEINMHLFYDAMELFGHIDVEENEYRFESSLSGFLTLCNLKTNRYLNSRIDPAWEAYERAKNIYNPKMQRFCTLGCELGYLAWQIYELSNRSIDIYIYEADQRMIDYARQFGVLDMIPEENLHIVVVEKHAKLLNRFSENFQLYDIDLAMLNIEEDLSDRFSDLENDSLKRLRITLQTTKDFLKITEQNFYRNHAVVDKYIDELYNKNDKNQWIVICGGPSLDQGMEYLKSSQETKTIVVATTVVKKLLKAGIRPDYIAALDPQNRTFKHMEGLQITDIPLIISDGANWQFAQNHNGEKYMVPTLGFYFSDDFYKEQKREVWNVGGTIASFCVQIAAKCGAKEIELLGVDLAYPLDHSHATGTMDDSAVDHTNMILVKDVNGNKVYTTNIFADYILDVEERIKENPHVKFYNLSNCGAYIQGCKKKNINTDI